MKNIFYRQRVPALNHREPNVARHKIYHAACNSVVVARASFTPPDAHLHITFSNEIVHNLARHNPRARGRRRINQKSIARVTNGFIYLSH